MVSVASSIIRPNGSASFDSTIVFHESVTEMNFFYFMDLKLPPELRSNRFLPFYNENISPSRNIQIFKVMELDIV